MRDEFVVQTARMDVGYALEMVLDLPRFSWPEPLTNGDVLDGVLSSCPHFEITFEKVEWRWLEFLLDGLPQQNSAWIDAINHNSNVKRCETTSQTSKIQVKFHSTVLIEVIILNYKVYSVFLTVYNGRA